MHRLQYIITRIVVMLLEEMIREKLFRLVKWMTPIGAHTGQMMTSSGLNRFNEFKS